MELLCQNAFLLTGIFFLAAGYIAVIAVLLIKIALSIWEVFR